MAIEGMRIIDCHHHVGAIAAVARERRQAAMAPDSPEYSQAEAAVRLQTMRYLGVDQAVLIPGHGYLRPRGQEDTIRINDAIAAYRDSNPDAFPAALAVIEPLHGSASFDELRRIKSELGLAGVSFHARFQGVATNSAYVLALAREMVKLDLVPFVHAVAASRDEDWWKVQDFAESIAEVPVLALDAFTSSEKAWEAVRVAQKTPNLYFETSGCSDLAFILPLIEEVGADRVVFGTDQYSALQSRGPGLRNTILHQLVYTDRIEAGGKRAILCDNVRRLLKIA